MSINVYVRSTLGNNLPSSVRPDGMDIFLQLDIHKSHLTGTEALWANQSVDCSPNCAVTGLYPSTANVRILNPYKGVYDSYWSTTNNEIDSDLHSLEDGRSRRYFVEGGDYWHMVSLPITQSTLPLLLHRFSSNDNFSICSFQQLRLFRRGEERVEFLTTIIFGKNTPDYEKISCESFTNDIKQFMLQAEDAVAVSKNWASKSKNGRSWVVILAKDHSAPIDAFDVDSFYSKHSRNWKMPGRDDLFSDPGSQSGWLDIYGWRSSEPSINVDISMGDYDDHSPCQFSISLPFFTVPLSEQSKWSKSFYVQGKWGINRKYKTHDGSLITELEYQQWRRSNAIVY